MKTNILLISVILTIVATLTLTPRLDAISFPRSEITPVTAPNDVAAIPATRSAEKMPLLYGAETFRERLVHSSLADTELPDIPAMDAQGHLTVDRRVRDIFDYFLALKGERKDAEIQTLITDFMALHLTKEAATEAIQLLNQYLALNTASRELTESDSEALGLQEKLEAHMRKRREILGDGVADAFFGEEEAYDLYSLQKVRQQQQVASDKVIDSTLASEAFTSLPDPMRERQLQALHQQQLLQGTRELEKQGASAAEIYQYQMLQGDASIADRYQRLDTQRQQWQERYTDYRKEWEIIYKSFASETEKKALINQLQTQAFAGEERLRVQSLDRMNEKSITLLFSPAKR